MKRLRWWSAVVALELVAAGCGSSHRAAEQGSSVSLDIPVVWDLEFKHSRLAGVGWAGHSRAGRPPVLTRCLQKHSS